MGYTHELDDRDEHEGWIAMTYADGRISSGTSCAAGHYLDGYAYLPSDPNDTRSWGRIDPAYLRPNSEIAGWLPRCACGWVGIETPVIETGTDADRGREPSGDQEHLIMDQWRLHIRDVIPAVYPTTPAAARLSATTETLTTMTDYTPDIPIDVRYEPDHETPTMQGVRPMLTHWNHPLDGPGWTLWYFDDPSSPTAGVEEQFIPGDITDVDQAVMFARLHLEAVMTPLMLEVLRSGSGGDR